MNRKFVTSIVAVILVLSMIVPALADGTSAAAWLKTQQNADGGFGSPDSSIGATADVILAAASAGENAFTWGSAGATAMDYIKANIGSAIKAGDISKVVLALSSNGLNPRTALDKDLVVELESMIGTDGRYGGEADFINEHCLSMIALSSVFRPANPQATNYLLNTQLKDGTWSWSGDKTPGTGDNNTAAIAVVALIAAGLSPDNAQIQATIAHFHKQQNPDGGFPYINPSDWGTESDANSTAVVIWALIAAGEDPAGSAWKHFGQNGTSAADKIKGFQNDGGAFAWKDAFGDDNFMATVQGVIAIQGKTLPFAKIDVDQPVKEPEPADPETTTPETTDTTESGAAKGSDTEGPPPETLPETGGVLWLSSALLSAGAGLVGVGAKMARRKHK